MPLLSLKIISFEEYKMDKLLPSQNPPGGLAPSEVPMFISFGFDDNGYSGFKDMNNTYGINWAAKLFHSLKNPSIDPFHSSFMAHKLPI